MSDDTISRQDLLSKINRIDRLPMLVDGNLIYVVPRENVNKIIKNMPSVQPEPIWETCFYAKGIIEDALYDSTLEIVEPEQKKGEWIEDDDATVRGHCSVCGWESHYCEDDVVGMPFCPNCGANMRGE